MPSPLSGIRESFRNYQNVKRDKESRQIDDLVKYAQLADAGYIVRQTPKKGFFGRSQMTLDRDPQYSSIKDLQRQKLQNDLEMGSYKLQNARRYFGASSGQPQGVSGNSQEDFVMAPDGRFVPNPSKPKPLNALQEAKLAESKRKQAEAEAANQAKEESLINAANENLLAIKEAKKGRNFFGLLGNLPSQVAPSTIMSLGGKYGKRKNWENNINKVLSGKVLEVMNQMKAASKTGATGFGALNEKELAILQGASTALSRDLAPDDAMRYLNEIETMQRRVLARGGKKFGQKAPQVPEWVPKGDEAFYQQEIQGGTPPQEIEAFFRKKAGSL